MASRRDPRRRPCRRLPNAFRFLQPPPHLAFPRRSASGLPHTRQGMPKGLPHRRGEGPPGPPQQRPLQEVPPGALSAAASRTEAPAQGLRPASGRGCPLPRRRSRLRRGTLCALCSPRFLLRLCPPSERRTPPVPLRIAQEGSRPGPPGSRGSSPPRASAQVPEGVPSVPPHPVPLPESSFLQFPACSTSFLFPFSNPPFPRSSAGLPGVYRMGRAVNRVPVAKSDIFHEIQRHPCPRVPIAVYRTDFTNC